ncbi:hypothetical protein PO909_033091 [Leuciscus waleckii]
MSCPDGPLLPPPSRRHRCLSLLADEGALPRLPPLPHGPSSSLHPGRIVEEAVGRRHSPPRAPLNIRQSGAPETGCSEMASSSFQETVAGPLLLPAHLWFHPSLSTQSSRMTVRATLEPRHSRPPLSPDPCQSTPPWDAGPPLASSGRTRLMTMPLHRAAMPPTPGPVIPPRCTTKGEGLPFGPSGQLGEEQTLPRAEDLFSLYGNRLGRHVHAVTADLPLSIRGQECGSTETISEAPGAYGIRSRSKAARIASYETASALALRSSPEVGMATWHAPSPSDSDLPSDLHPVDEPQFSMGRSALRTSFPACCCINRCLHRLHRCLWDQFGDAQVDLFASHDSSHCDLFYSLTEGTLGTDALAHSWPWGLRKYALPPVSLLAQILRKIREDEEQVILVAPYWHNRTWFPELVLLATATPWPIPLRKDLLSQGRGTLWHPRPDLWNLHVWLLDRTRQV